MRKSFKKSDELLRKVEAVIPLASQTFSKSHLQYVKGAAPLFIEKGKGATVWDVDGNRYTDLINGLLSVVLGYQYKKVDDAIRAQLKKGISFSLPSLLEYEVAELLKKHIPCAEMARFGKNGSDATSGAIRLARAVTGRDHVAVCGYHGWHDWYLAANIASDKALDGHLLSGLTPLGVPRKLKGTAHPFKYNDTGSFLRLINKYKNSAGVVVLEAVRNYYPEKEFIRILREVTKDLKIPLVVDEVSSGFRLNTGGAHLLFNLKPDIAVFAKGISNGFPMAAIIGRKTVMGLAQDTFISSTYWTERIGPTAALATIRKMKEKKVQQHLIRIGEKVQAGWEKSALRHGVKIEVCGIAPLGHFSFLYENPLVLKTLFTQFMLERGFLATTAFYASFAHKDRLVDKYLNAADEAFAFIAKAIAGGDPEKILKGPVCHEGFRRIT